jgi:RHS repeat-associated protein
VLALAPVVCALLATLQVPTSTLGGGYAESRVGDADLVQTPILEGDVAGRLSSSSDGASYRYDAMGRRVRKTAAGQTTVYHHDPSGRVIAETDLAGVKQRIFVYLGNKLVTVDGCAAGATAACGERQWYHTDSLGSVLARTDVTGSVLPAAARLDYGPWGEQLSVSGQAGDRQYNGRVFDPGTGFHDYGARMYWPQIGRFISADSVMGSPGNPMTLNRYSYVLNNPYKYVDPSGHQAVRPNRLVNPVTEPPIQARVRMIRSAIAAGRIEARGGSADTMGPPGTPSESAVRQMEWLADAVDPKSEIINPATGQPVGMAGTGTFYVDPEGNVIRAPPGGGLTGSPDGRYVQARGPDGEPTGVRIDAGHKPAGHPDPRAQVPHGHVPGVTNPDGTPWLPVKP